MFMNSAVNALSSENLRRKLPSSCITWVGGRFLYVQVFSVASMVVDMSVVLMFPLSMLLRTM